MSPDELSRILMALDMTQQRCAKLLGRDDRTVRYWIAGDRGISPEAAIILRLLARGRITVAEIEAATDRD
jgi:plasmid maintenance system antidote protein VapI